MPITINGSGTVTGITAGLTSAAMPAGTVIQTVSDVLDTASLTVCSNTDTHTIAGLAATITLGDSSNKVLVQVALKTAYDGSYNQLVWWLNRNTSSSDNAIALGAQEGSNRRRCSGSGGIYNDTQKHVGNENLVFLDTPGSVGPHTYNIRFSDAGGNSGEFYVNRPRNDSDTDVYMRTISTITVQEIAA